MAFNRKPDILSSLHHAGHLAIHMTSVPDRFVFDKCEDPRIINNLRQDGGTEFKAPGYRFYPIISATCLPKSEMKIAQNTYGGISQNGLLVFLDLENSIIKQYGPADIHTEYKVNKKNRESYVSFRVDKLSKLSYSERLNYVDAINHKLALIATQPRKHTRGLFKGHLELPSYHLGMNEITIKLYNESVVAIGVLARLLKVNPHLALNLIRMQHAIQQSMNMAIPIVIYNESTEDIELDFIDSTPQKILTNQYVVVDPEKALIQIRKKFPEGIPAPHPELIWKKINTPIDELLDDEKNNTSLANRSDLVQQLNYINNMLQELLPPFKKSDKVITIHKEKNPKAPSKFNYEEIDQSALKHFVKKLSILPGEQTRIILKAYNVQFRIQIYLNLLAEKDNSVNLVRLSEDLRWAEHLINEIKNIKFINSAAKTMVLENLSKGNGAADHNFHVDRMTGKDGLDLTKAICKLLDNSMEDKDDNIRELADNAIQFLACKIQNNEPLKHNFVSIKDQYKSANAILDKLIVRNRM